MEMSEVDLIYIMRVIYINSNLNILTEFTGSSRNTEFEDFLPWNLSQTITKIFRISIRIVISYLMEWGIPFSVRWKVSGN